MTDRKRPLSAAEQLADEVVALRQEVAVLRETMDEIRECIEWAMHNGQPILVPNAAEPKSLRIDDRKPVTSKPVGDERQESLFSTSEDDA